MFVGHNIPSDSRIYISMYGEVKVSVFDKNTDENKGERFNEKTGEERDTTLWSFREMEESSPVQLKNEIIKWIRENYESIQTMVSASNAYAEIEYITYLTISFKIVPISGEGYVILKHPEKFPFIFSPVSEADCFFKCLEEAGCGSMIQFTI